MSDPCIIPNENIQQPLSSYILAHFRDSFVAPVSGQILAPHHPWTAKQNLVL